LAEFDSIETVYSCLKTMNNLKIFDNTILVKCDTKTQQFLEDWVQEKSEEWRARKGNDFDPQMIS